VVQEPRDLVEHDANVLRADGRCDSQQLFHRQHVAMLITHHGHIIQAIHVADALVVGLALGKLLGGPVQQSDMRIGTLDNFAVELEHEPQHAVGGRMLRTEIHRVITDFGHRSPPHE
jgi:hypothetical protein